MRVLTWIVMLAGIAWCGWWWVAATALERGTAAWFETQAAQGRIASRGGETVSGFPNRLDLTVDAPALADARSGFAWRAPFAQVFAMTWKPWHVIAALPGGQVLTLPDGREVILDGEKVMASVVVKPDTALTLDRTSLAGDALVLRPGTVGRPAEEALSIAQLRFGTRQAPARAMGHEVALEVTGIGLPPALLAGLPQGSALPGRIDRLRLDTELGFDAPLDRHAATTRPGLTVLALREARLDWGDLALTGDGTLTRDARGRAEGRIAIRIDNWRLALDAAVAAGLLTPEVAPTWARAMELLEQAGGRPGRVELPLVMSGGRMSLGPVPLGPAPQMAP